MLSDCSCCQLGQDMSHYNKHNRFWSRLSPSEHHIAMFQSHVKHILHCLTLFFIIISCELSMGGLSFTGDGNLPFDPWHKFGSFWMVFLYVNRSFIYLALPQALFSFFGLTLYNAFPDPIPYRVPSVAIPFICFRVVTKGDYPDLVFRNISRNLRTCMRCGLGNFLIEVVTDKPIHIPRQQYVRETVVPTEYRPAGGALFKARALQYCLEDGVNTLQDEEWIVHLDEETLLTDQSIRGILKFIAQGKHQFGQGMITYASDGVINWLTTLADVIRVADDMGKIRFQLNMFQKPVLGWKGSYIVSQVGAERDVSYDHGPAGSIAEDCFSGMVGASKGYKYGFIDGEMWEKSPFTIWDFLQQRKRWVQGLFLLVHSPKIPFSQKFLLTIAVYTWLGGPFAMAIGLWFSDLFALPCPGPFNFVQAFLCGLQMYMYIFGAVKSFSVRQQGPVGFLLCILGALCTLPFSMAVDTVAILWGLIQYKYQFYVVRKDKHAHML